MNSTDEPPLPKNKVFTGCVIIIIASFVIGIAFVRFFVYDINSKSLEPKAAMKGLEIAIMGYKTEYGSLPFVGDAPTQDNAPYDTTDANGKALMDILLAKDLTRNPQAIHFWEPPSAKSSGAGYTSEGGLRDSWGKQGFKIILDYNNDGKIANPYAGRDGEPDEISSSVIFYSAGANGIFETGSSTVTSKVDDVRSWQ